MSSVGKHPCTDGEHGLGLSELQKCRCYCDRGVMSAGDIVAALPHVKCAQTRKRGSGRRSEQPSHRQTGAAAAVLLLWAAALLPAPAAALNTFSIFAKKKEVSRCGHEHDEDEYSYATARIASVKAQVRC